MKKRNVYLQVSYNEAVQRVFITYNATLISDGGKFCYPAKQLHVWLFDKKIKENKRLTTNYPTPPLKLEVEGFNPNLERMLWCWTPERGFVKTSANWCKVGV